MRCWLIWLNRKANCSKPNWRGVKPVSMSRILPDSTLTGLPPLSNSRARVLLLGSMPGAVSLQQQQYYAHPRNLFWPIMARLAGFNADLPYTEKTQALINRGVALWDVIGNCQR